MELLDRYLNNITMYRLVLYILIFLLGVSLIFSFLKILPFDVFSLAFSALFLVIVSWLTNTIFAKVFQAPTNLESTYISALILALIIPPIKAPADLMFLFWASVLTISSKYILAIGKKHIFNPVALAVAVTALSINQSASWWIGNPSMAPFVLLGGFLIVRKIKRIDLVLSFLLAASVTVLGFSFLKGNDLTESFQKIIYYSPLLFFASVMLTEPLTTPPKKSLQIIYGALIGFLFAPQIHVGSFYSTPELSLLVGNIFSYLVSPKEKLILKLKEKIQLTEDIYDFVFQSSQKLKYLPGQYIEWTLKYDNPDSRGVRRFFTLASSPTEDNIRIGLKFFNSPSSFKKNLLSMNPGSEIVVSQLAGEFVLPKDQNKKLVFIAGGIGITPFRSIIKYLLDNNQKRQVTLFYSNKLASEIVYTDVFNQAAQKLGIETIYTITDTTQVPAGWKGRVGYIDQKMIQEEVPYFTERFFYISGPHSMVVTFKQVLIAMGVKNNQIITDYFPGFA